MPKVEIFDPYQQPFLEKNISAFSQFMNLNAETFYKENVHRSVAKFTLWKDDRPTDFFIKRHLKPETKDKWRDLLSLKWPLSDAKQELAAIHALNALGIATMVPAAWGEAPGLLKRKSFLVTESLGDLERLEDYLIRKFKKNLSPGEVKFKRELLLKVSRMVRTLHRARYCHRDLYCGHILVRETDDGLPELYLIDLQRLRRHIYLKRRWRTKDLAALNFTAAPGALSRTDRLRFFLSYLCGSGVRQKLTPGLKRWIRGILARTEKMARHTLKKRQRHLEREKAQKQ